jgi:2-polyprenyl-3-methyl-5-hydroxy-6-metoxy-1,4-benzoquinol methylase
MRDPGDRAFDADDSVLQQILGQFADPDWKTRVQRRYVRFFSDIGARTVLDVGCGPGLFLRLLSEAGIDAHGVDSNPEAIEQCRRDGHERVTQSDAVEYLATCRNRGQRFDGVFCSHLVEHLPGPEGVRLLRLASEVLASGGRLVVVTPNVANLWMLSQVFWIDPTHVRPYPRRLLEAVMAVAQLDVVASFDDGMTRRAIGGWKGLLQLPGEMLRLGRSTFSGGDSVVVGQQK